MFKQNRICILFFLLFVSVHAIAQEKLEVKIVNDGTLYQEQQLNKLVAHEIHELMQYRREVHINYFFSNNKQERASALFDSLFTAESTDLIIASGPLGSQVLSERATYSKPSIASIVLDADLLNLQMTEEGTSGKNNFTFIESPFDFEKDIQKFKSLHPFKHLGIVIEEDLSEDSNKISKDYFQKIVGGKYSLVSTTGDVTKDMASLPNDVDGIYFIYSEDYQEGSTKLKNYFSALHEKGIPTFAMMGEAFVRAGAFASLSNENIAPTYARRIALDVLKIYEGSNASDLPVGIDSFQDGLYLNLRTAAQLNLVPSWGVLTEAILIDSDEDENLEQLDLKSAIVEALSNNLSLQEVSYDGSIADQERKLASSKLLPQVEANASYAIVDDNAAVFNAKQNATIGAKLSQVIFSEPAFANVTIQKLLAESKRKGVEAAELDLVYKVSESYMQYLQAKSYEQIQGQNLQETKENLDVSCAKYKVGQASITDVYRLEAQMAQNKNEVYDAKAQTESARYVLNQVLGRSQEMEFRTKEIGITDEILYVNDSRFYDLLQGNSSSKKMMNFLVEEAHRNLPEIQQVQLSIQAQERLNKSQKRKLYLPSIGLSAEASKSIFRAGEVELPIGDDPVTLSTGNLTWNVGAGVTLPLFQGYQTKREINKTKLEIDQLKTKEALIRQQLELQVRTNVAKVRATYLKITQSKVAQEKANKSFKILQDHYRQGLIDITDLINGQNTARQTEIQTTTTIYQFVTDFMALERSIGNFYFLDAEEKKEEFFNRMLEYILN